MNHILKNGDEQVQVQTETVDVTRLHETLKSDLLVHIKDILFESWGEFPSDFLKKHILNSKRIILSKIENKYVGFCAMSLRRVMGHEIHYIEFLVVAKKYQKIGLGTLLSFLVVKREILKNISRLILGKEIEIFFITPNVRVLVSMAKIASFIYPNPFQQNENGEIEDANNETWQIATELLQTSDDPYRKLDRQGLVLHGSYANTPWLIYNNDNAPWHKEDHVNRFARKYLGYQKGEDKEFMVRAQINLKSVLKYLFKR